MNVAIYTYVRYLNQMGQRPDLHRRHSAMTIDRAAAPGGIQLLKVQIKFLGWLFDPKFRYFLYAWSSNATQGQGAQVVLAGNLTYNFNSTSPSPAASPRFPACAVPRATFPFWLNVDNRLLADEFFRPSYTSGFWVQGNITPTLRYQVMIGNNLSTLGVSSAQLDNHFNTLATALVWEPATQEFGIGFGDFEDHQQVATRLGLHYTHSTEDKQSQPNTDSFENTQIRLSDGTVVFTPNIFGPGITVDRAALPDEHPSTRASSTSGCALEGEYYSASSITSRDLAPRACPTSTTSGFQAQASTMLIPTDPAGVSGGIVGRRRVRQAPGTYAPGVNCLPVATTACCAGTPR